MTALLRCLTCGALVLAATTFLCPPPVYGDNELSRRASWSQPTVAEVHESLATWLESRKLDAETTAKIDALWSQEPGPSSAAELLENVATSIAAAEPAARELVLACRGQKQPGQLPIFEILSDQAVPSVVRNNLRLLYGRWLVGQRMFNEAQQQISRLHPDDVVDPGMLLFYQSVIAHHLIDKEVCLPKVTQLLENEPLLPRRYVEVARLMEVDLAPLKTDSLDEVARLMRSIQARLELGRAGKRVRTEEEAVLSKLDKMIEELEKQRQQQQQSGSGGGNLQPSSPMQDSFPGGGSGPGNIDPKKIGDKSGWGDLPPKRRQEALQQISREFPSHYRDVIEEYFRKLARDGVGG